MKKSSLVSWQTAMGRSSGPPSSSPRDRGHAEDLAQATLIRTFLAWDRLHAVALHAGFGGRLHRDRAQSSMLVNMLALV